MKTKQTISSLWKMIITQIKMTVRNRQLLFWTILFPLLFMFLLGSVFNDSDQTSFSVGIVDKDSSKASKELVKGLKKVPVYKVYQGSEKNEIEKLKNGKRRLVIEIPEGFGKSLKTNMAARYMQQNPIPVSGTNPTQNPQVNPQTNANPRANPIKPAEIKVYYDGTNLNTSQSALASLKEVTNSINYKMTNFQPAITTDNIPLKTKSLKYIDFLIPGILAMMIMQAGIFNVSLTLANWREKGILRRFSATPMPRWILALSKLVSGLLTTMLQIGVLLLAAWLAYDIKVQGSIIDVIILAMLGSMTFMSMGFLAGSLAKKAETVEPIANLFSMPMMFLGGVFFPVDSAPAWLQPIIKALPITYLSNGFRDIINTGAALDTLGKNMLIIAAWLLAALVVASWRFKWE